MDHNTNQMTSNENDVPPITFNQWGLDFDDAEFRAGYPFTPTPSEEMNEADRSCDMSSSTSADDFQSINSQNNDFNGTTKEEDELSRASSFEEDKFMEAHVESSTIDDQSNDYGVNINQTEDNEKHKRNDCDQFSAVQIDYVDDEQADQNRSAE